MHSAINIKGKLYDFDTPKVMSIVNLTPDSFFAESRYRLSSGDGVDIVDVGACSTRPGSEAATETEEAERLERFMPEIISRYGAFPLSVDTFRPCIARLMLEKYGFDIVNDVSGGNEEMFELCAGLGAVYVLTWPNGGGVSDMLYFFSKKLDSLYRAGVNDVILDPGFGFGKDVANNYEIAANMGTLDEFGLPVLAGISRKRMLWQLLKISPDDALNATTALNCFLLQRGVDIIRVHDTREAKQAVTIFNQFHKSTCSS